MKKIILAVMVAAAAFAFANPASANPNRDNIQYSENIPQKKKVVKKKNKKKVVKAQKVAPEHNAFVKCEGIFNSCNSKKEEVVTSSVDETSASYWSKEYARNNPPPQQVATVVTTRSGKQLREDQRRRVVQKCGWFSCQGEYEVVAEAKKWEGKTAMANRHELRNLLAEGNGGDPVDPARIPWCAAFANAILNRLGYETTNSLTARSFLAWGKKTKEPLEGDIVVLRRGKDEWTGHVGFFAGYEVFEGVRYVKVLGGNQNKAVNVAYFPVSMVLGYRTAA